MKIIERMNRLIEVANQEDLGYTEDAIRDCCDYFTSVLKMETGIRIAKFRANTQKEYIDIVENLDRSRRYKHNSAIVSVKVLNRLCEIYGVEAIFQGNIDDRQEVANFIQELANIYYKSNKIKELR
jgi:predicted nucleic acid-binding protein